MTDIWLLDCVKGPVVDLSSSCRGIGIWTRFSVSSRKIAALISEAGVDSKIWAIKLGWTPNIHMLDRKVVPNSKYRISRLPSWCCGYDTPEAGSSDVVVSVISSQSFLALRIARRSSCPVDGFSHRCASILSRKFGRVNLKQRAQKKEQNSKFGELKLCLNHCQIRIVEIRLFQKN